MITIQVVGVTVSNHPTNGYRASHGTHCRVANMWHTGWANETCLDKASMQSLRLHFGKSLKTVAEASTTEAATEVQCLVDYCSKLAAELTLLLLYC